VAKSCAETSGAPIFSLRTIGAASELAQTMATVPTEVRDGFAELVVAS